MPYIDMQDHKEAFAMVETVRSKFEGYTKNEVKRAILAHDAQVMVAHLTDETFKPMVSNKSLKNYHVEVNDVTNAHTFFVPITHD